MRDGVDRLASRPSSLQGLYTRSPVLFCFLGMAILMIVVRSLGLQLNGDVDDLVKLHEIRVFLETGPIFDRTLPGILQSEPYVTHWPWIVDLPYALFASVLMPFAGFEPSLTIAGLVVPLLLLAPALYFYNRLLIAVGFANTVFALPLASIFAIRAFFEFAPGRIDYHNLQILLLLATLVLTLSQNRFAAFGNGVLTALALAISVEFAPFYVLVLGIYAFDFIFAQKDGANRIVAFGLALAIGAAVLLAAIVPPSAYGTAKCDTYSALHALALIAAGLSFAVVPALAGQRKWWATRAAILVALAAASLATLLMLFPQCLTGPYAQLDSYVRENMLDRIPQEMSLFRRPDFVLSGSFPSMMILFVGALAPTVICLAQRGHDRAVAIIALFSLLALTLGVGYFRYLRYVPMFSGIGLLFVVAAFVPPHTLMAAYLTPRMPVIVPRYMLILPGLAMSAAMVIYSLSARPIQAAITAAYLASSCDLGRVTLQDGWPAEAVVLSPPTIGAYLLALADGPKVVAVPNHRAAIGIERTYRFLDPLTADPRAILGQSKATHVAVCAWRGAPAPQLEKTYPFAAMLMEGRPPSWLAECPTDTSSPLRIYRYRNAHGTDPACPASKVLAQARPISGTSVPLIARLAGETR
ncbi:hypothetical protein LGH82_16115 [Mesorhizobium sp. PAMC28654]|uniref:hypothetical protein n=1 Tax=Mesorhizobium sp. PAMC28654 TaxID=2880934 RepID=UPI001D0B7FF9|nr:hypothetical protein [Mesorhizobium sp. PAMC28654]UDL92615.1 hypothetical protein LGH82_16115 [Mesorhizobium sp. PAMC28654]